MHYNYFKRLPRFAILNMPGWKNNVNSTYLKKQDPLLTSITWLKVIQIFMLNFMI